MKIFKNTLILCLIFSFSIISCKEKIPKPSDMELPVIQKILPALSHQAYDFGDTAYFKVNFFDNKELKEVSVRLYLQTDENILFLQEFPNAPTASIDTFVIMNDPRFSELKFDIKAVDASGNVSLQSSHIHLR